MYLYAKRKNLSDEEFWHSTVRKLHAMTEYERAQQEAAKKAGNKSPVDWSEMEQYQ